MRNPSDPPNSWTDDGIWWSGRWGAAAAFLVDHHRRRFARREVCRARSQRATWMSRRSRARLIMRLARLDVSAIVCGAWRASPGRPSSSILPVSMSSAAGGDGDIAPGLIRPRFALDTNVMRVQSAIRAGAIAVHKGRVAVSILVAGLMAGAAFAQAPSSGPVAVYWVSAATTTGMQGGASMDALGGRGGGTPGSAAAAYQAQAAGQVRAQQATRRPGFGGVVGMAMGASSLGGFPGLPGFGRRPPPPDQAQAGLAAAGAAPFETAGLPGMGGAGLVHTLTLQLGSAQAASGPPQAAHFVPVGLGAGESLPLVTPKPRAGEVEADPQEPPQMTRRPRGRMLIYWGCGEHAQGPIVIDFAKIGAGTPPNMPFIAANPGRPPSPGRYATAGEWPNAQSAINIPASGSLVGAHAIRSNYSPEIRFSLGPEQDFLGPLQITARDPTPAGGVRVSWAAVPFATGYYAWLFGTQNRGETVVVWSSGSSANMMGALTDYLPSSEVRRLIGLGAVMAPDTTSCIVPSEVLKGSTFGMLSMIAYGAETNLEDPPRPRASGAPWNLRWSVKVRRKSATTALLGALGGREP